MKVQRTYISTRDWRASAVARDKALYATAPHGPVVEIACGNFTDLLTIAELDDLLVALHAAKDDLKHLLNTQEFEEKKK